MAQDGEKVRYAMGLFYDLPLLKTAASALFDLGLDPRQLCLAGERVAVESGNAGVWTRPEHTPHIIPLPRAKTVLGVLTNGTVWGAETPIAQALEAGAQAKPQRLPATNFWDVISEHLSSGALLLIARVPTARFQDEAMRALLRYSRHPVHAEEFFHLD
jgi:hypothetical protein